MSWNIRLRATALGFAAASLIASAPSSAAISEPHGQVTIKRDNWGVPHIYAGTTFGLFYGYGYSLAEDRLFQMEMLRRTARGTVAEVLGSAYVDYDKRTRSNYSPDSLERQYLALPADDRAIFDGYAAGLNKRIDEVLANRKLMPKEFNDFGFTPKKWTPVDTIAIFVHSVAIRYSDLNSEIANLAILTELKGKYGDTKGREMFDQLRWPHDSLAPTTVSALEQTKNPPPTFAAPVSQTAQLGKPITSIEGLSPEGIRDQEIAQLKRFGGVGPDAFPHASNLWLVGRTKSANADAILFNGPQMGDFAPGYIWAAGLHGAGYDLVGSSPLGSTWFIFGTNGRIGWGATAGFGDTVDIYQERLNPADKHQYWFDGSWRKMERRDETIQVRNGQSVSFPVYSTIHGPVVQFDDAKAIAYSKKRSWAGSEVQSLMAWMKSMRAGDFQEWRKAISGVTLPINNYYADVHGNIGYTFLGLMPKRPTTQDFRLPASGAGDMEWQGYLPFEANPWVLNPKQGYIANWNNKPQPNYNSSDTIYWSSVDHVREIQTRLEQKEKFTTEDAWNLNHDIMYVDDNARYFLPLIEKASSEWKTGSDASRAVQILRDWDHKTVDANDLAHTSTGYTLFHEILKNLVGEIAWAAPPSAGDFGSGTVSPYFPTMATKVMYNALAGKDAGVPQRVDLLRGQSASEVIRKAVDAAIVELTAKYSADPAEWHAPSERHVFETRNYAGIPSALGKEEVTLPAGMNRGTENDSITFKDGRVSYCDVTPLGQSGFVDPEGNKAPHYGDQLDLYAKNTCKPQLLDSKAVNEHANGVTTLKF